MQKILKFVQKWNDGAILADVLEESVLDWYAEEMKQSIAKQFSKQGQAAQSRGGLRMSQLGKPAVLLAADNLISVPEVKIPLSRQWIFITGDFFETTLMVIMDSLGHEISHMQHEVDFMGIKGHIDFVADDVLIEVKTMSGHYWNSFTVQPNDDRAYLTQLHLYQHSMQCRHAGWLCLNKWTSQLAYVPLDWDEEYIDRARMIIENFDKIKEFDDIKKYFAIPELERVNTVRNKIPECMKYSGMNELFYNFDNRGNPVSLKF